MPQHPPNPEQLPPYIVPRDHGHGPPPARHPHDGEPLRRAGRMQRGQTLPPPCQGLDGHQPLHHLPPPQHHTFACAGFAPTRHRDPGHPTAFPALLNEHLASCLLLNGLIRREANPYLVGPILRPGRTRTQ
ncbi:hypothetical protein GRAN_3158 [Granulicella sibirica]|uniref:Uncharacterized protein n=1 Tax=Granulicella sibirica TaxID=2479048 RepID=A0A4Q0T411_9BACT|nr:hypothetical protein GRAN_3158 [Granulicella sibirica]